MIADLKPYAEYKESGLPWLGQVPAHWRCKRGKSVFDASTNDRKAARGASDCRSARGVVPSQRATS